MIFIGLHGTGNALAQQVSKLTDEQIRQFVHQARSSGMSESQIEQMAQARGFSLSDIANMRRRFGQVEGETIRSAATPGERSSAETNVTREQPTTPLPLTVPVISPVFGASLFGNASLTFEPNVRMPTPRNYQIGPDDELIVDVYGNAQQTYRPKVSPEGSIRIENLSPIYVNGLTIEQAEQRIISRLRMLYQGLNSSGSGINAQVTLGSVRSIKVTLMGQVVRPGTYTLSSLTTVFNALYASGGPSPERGSFRTIRVYRNNRLVRTLDCYDFLLRADQKDNIRLLDQDIVFIDHYKTRVELSGEVKQPGFYEIKPGETLQNVLDFAGGYSDRAYTASINLRRNTPTEQKLITITSAEVAGFIPQPGDFYHVGTILDRIENKVTISGAVFRPGDFALQTNATLKHLIRSAEGLREDAFLNRATIRRLRENLDPEIISVDLGQFLRGELPEVPLQRDDIVHITAISDLRQGRTVSIQGAVNHGGIFAFADSMTVANLIVLAGGFSEGAISTRMEIARRINMDTAGLPDNQNIRLITFELDRNLRLTPADANLTLKPFDQIFVRASSRYEVQQGAAIVGEVVYPGSYAIRMATDRITDLVARAGGLKPDAYLTAARFSRKGERISVDMQKILANASDVGNLLLEDRDSLTIPRRVELVRIRGEVLNPAVVEFDPTKSFRAYIDEAGNFTKKAIRRKTYIIAANGKIKPTKSFLGIRHYPKPERGMEIIIPAELPKDQTKVSGTERVALLTVIASASAVILTALRIFTN